MQIWNKGAVNWKLYIVKRDFNVQDRDETETFQDFLETKTRPFKSTSRDRLETEIKLTSLPNTV